MTTSLVLLDLQRGLLGGGIQFEKEGQGDAALVAAKALLQAARAAGILVVHVGVARAHRRGWLDEPRTSAAKAAGKAPRDVLPMAPGSGDVDFMLEMREGEEVVYKQGVSAFEGTRLDQLLRAAGVTDVVVGGAFTHMVVESTVRQGFDMGYRMVVAKDACCAPRIALHENSLVTGIPNFAVIDTAGEIAARFGRKQ